MAFRSFVDSSGNQWQVWDISPVLSERRNEQRRVRSETRVADRRVDDRRHGQSRRAVLHGSYASGWLCFESSRERRRLAPIPSDWTSCSGQALETYCRRAAPVNSARTASGELLADPLAETG
jgi:hypothetical protein